MKIRAYCLLSLFFLVGSRAAWGFAEMIRYGYGNCTACHVSPDGGGTLTSYGRTISHDPLSAWNWQDDERFAYAVTLPENLELQGEFRSVLISGPPAFHSNARFIIMQSDLEGAFQYKKFGVDAAFGYSDGFVPQTFVEGLVSRRHWLSYQPAESWSFRAGRFNKAFGINTPDHIIATKKGLGWDERSETYNVEAAYIQDPWEVFLTADFGRPDQPDLNAEQGAALRADYYFNERFKVGLSYFYGTNSFQRRHVTGPYMILGFTKRFYLMAEGDFENTMPNGSPTAAWGFVDYTKLGYEFIQGFQIFVTQELTQQDLSNAQTQGQAYAIGLDMFPLTHFEVSATYQKRYLPNSDTDWFYLMGHFYL